MYPLIRPLLFRLEPERAHALSLSLISMAGRFAFTRTFLRACYTPPPKPVRAFGLDFPNPVGLAAGYDKDGLGWRGLACLGFGHLEVGTVTLLPQPGNPRPRLFRLPEDEALINRMGFPGHGAQAVAARLRRRQPGDVVLGVNLGKGKSTPLEEAAQDYLGLMEVFLPLADYLAINVSSPNTEGLRRLQARQALERLLLLLVERRDAQQAALGRRVPLLVKLSPDLDDGELDDALAALLNAGVDGVIATNTTVGREGLESSPRGQALAGEKGGLSGAPLRELSTRMVREISRRTEGRLPIIGAGGVMNAADARQKLEAGASLVQVYTGLVYAGPGLAKRIVAGL
ncbi:MAG: quinone-dependent dihydroorotate dehydrogenase [Anaerolineales bacterium]|nr:quinone-dependent dihydroorotate dehydrogenase [Anaerolineales bacterium]